jgi:hypothetical protein
MNDVFEIPANDQRATRNGGNSDMQRIIVPLRCNNPGFHVHVLQIESRLRSLDDINDVEKLNEEPRRKQRDTERPL